MAINNKDDYEKLAKILYPSIEASGNVYYGQTRKLTMDEILGKNELNFESHIETFNNGDFTYSSYFMWKLGPFYGSIKFDANKGDNLSSIKWDSFPDTDRFEIINPYENEQNYFLYNVEMYDYGQEDQEIPHIYTHNINLYGTVFAKYDIIIDESITSHEILNSGEYNTYSNDAHCEFCNLCLTSGYNPTDHDDYILGNRNFFVESKNGHNYLYIQICSNTILDEFYELPIGEPFKITSRNSTAEFYISTPTGNPDPNYVYSFDGSNWHTLGIGYENKVDIPADSSIYIKGRCNTIDNSNYIQFSNLNEYSKLYASGDIKWLNYNLNDDTYTMRPYAFYKLFSSLGMNRTLVSAPNLSYFSLANNCYANLFQSCNLLESMPILPAKTLAENCYAYMFQSCSNIKKASTLPAKNIPNNAYTAIFSYISSLNNITCLAISKQQSSFTFWLDSVAQQGILNVSKTDIFPENTSSGKPNGWEFNVVNNIGSGLYIRNASVYTNSVYHKIKNPYFVLSGSDSEINGRGLLNSSTLFNMLDTNPLYNNGVTFDTYNKDGSFNQEVWGYKCFNSPVMFRNGIYGECSSLTTLNEEPQFSFNIENTATGDQDSLQSYGIGSILSCRDVNSYTDDTDEYKPYAYSELSVIHSELDDKHALYDGGITHFTAQYKCGASVNETMYAGVQSYVHHYRNVFLQYQGAVPDYTYYNHMVNKICAGNVLITLNDLCNITYGESHEDSYIEVNNQVIPNQNETVNLGSPIKRYFNTYSKYVHAKELNVETIDANNLNLNLNGNNICFKSNAIAYNNLTTYGDIIVGDNTGCTMTFHSEEQSHYGYSDISVVNNESDNSARIIFNVNGVNRIECVGDLLPYDNEEYNFGAANYRWDNIFTRQLQCDSVFTNSIIPSPAGSLSIGSTNNFADVFYVDQVHINHVMIYTEEQDGLLNITANGMEGAGYITGTEDIYLQADNNIFINAQSEITINASGVCEIYCNGFIVNTTLTADAFEGVLPYAKQSNTQYHPTIPVGSIVWIWINSSYNVTLGQTVTAASFTPAAHLAIMNSNSAYSEGSDLLPTGSTFVVLMEKAIGVSGAIPCMRKS